MILVLAGTRDGRDIVQKLTAYDYPVIASVVSNYGKQLLQESAALMINDRPLPETSLKEFLLKQNVTTIVDATHPYASHISETAMQLSRELALQYIRYERPSVPLPDYGKFYRVTNYVEAAKQAVKLGNNIFLTTGSRNLAQFTTAEVLQGCHLIVRVLPEPAVITSCRDLGLAPSQIIAMQGPFSKELNKELYKNYQADVIITKNSGSIGGTDTKIAAAMELNLPVIIIDRPPIKYPCVVTSYEAIMAKLER